MAEKISMGPSTDWFGDPLANGSLKNKSIHGTAINALSRLANQFVNVAGLIILARLLTPDEFGLVAMVLATLGIAEVLQDLGLSAATIRARTLTHQQASNLFWINALIGLAMSLICLAAAPWLTSLFEDPRVYPAALLMSPSFLIAGLTTQHSALMRRNMKFTAIARLALITSITTATASVLGASLDLGYAALIVGSLAGAGSKCLLYWGHCNWRPTRPRRHANIRPLLRFGTDMAIFGAFGFAAANVHSLVIGRLFGAAETGLFSRAIRIHQLLLGNLKEPLALVAPPALSRLRDRPQEFANFYYKACALSIMLIVPLMFLGTVLADEVVFILLGSQWHKATIVLQILSASMIPQIISVSTGWIFHSAGNSRLMMYWGIIGWSCTIVATVAGAQFGIPGIAIALTCAAWLLILPNLMLAFHGTSLRISTLAQHLFYIVCLGCLATLVGLTIKSQIAYEFSLLMRSILAGLGFISIYAGGLLLSTKHRALIINVVSELKSRIGR